MYSPAQWVILAISILISAIMVQNAYILTQLVPRKSEFLSVDEVALLFNTVTFLSNKAVFDLSRNHRNKIGFCCSADLDISVSAVALMKALTDDEEKRVKPEHHERIKDIQQLKESFLHYFINGAAAEQSMTLIDTFQQVVSLAESLKPNVHHGVGGNAATMAQRAALEGNHVLLGAAMGKKMKQHFHPDVEVAGHLDSTETEDVHLVLEYAQNDTWNTFKTPRANRYYLNHDIHNAQITALEEFESALGDFKATLVVIGGLQLMEVDLDSTRRLSRLKELSLLLQDRYVKRSISHYEFAAASDFALYNDIVKLVLPWVNSIGLNEQELFILHHYIITGEHAVTTTSRPSALDVSVLIADVIDYSERKRKELKKSIKLEQPLAALDRIHFHTLQFHILCQRDDSSWGAAKDALIQGAIVSSKIACGSNKTRNSSINDINLEASDIEVLLPRQVDLGIHGVREIDPNNPVQSWKEGAFECLLMPMLACKAPDHTAGLGDNISGAGLAYHTLK